MSDKITSKKTLKFYDFDPLLLPDNIESYELQFELKESVLVLKNHNLITISIRNCDITIKKEKNFSHDQLVLLDLFSKAIYYKNITNYDNFPTFFRTLKTSRNNFIGAGKKFGSMLKSVIDGNIGDIEILKDGTIITQQNHTSQQI